MKKITQFNKNSKYIYVYISKLTIGFGCQPTQFRK